MTNYEYMQHLPLDLFHSILGGLMGIDEMQNPEKANTELMTWLQSEIDEGFRKGQLLDYCDMKDRENQLLIENQHLKETNDYLVKEISKLARESIVREKILARLEAEVIKRINEYDPNQTTIV